MNKIVTVADWIYGADESTRSDFGRIFEGVALVGVRRIGFWKFSCILRFVMGKRVRSRKRSRKNDDGDSEIEDGKLKVMKLVENLSELSTRLLHESSFDIESICKLLKYYESQSSSKLVSIGDQLSNLTTALITQLNTLLNNTQDQNIDFNPLFYKDLLSSTQTSPITLHTLWKKINNVSSKSRKAFHHVVSSTQGQLSSSTTPGDELHSKNAQFTMNTFDDVYMTVISREFESSLNTIRENEHFDHEKVLKLAQSLKFSSTLFDPIAKQLLKLHHGRQN